MWSAAAGRVHLDRTRASKHEQAHASIALAARVALSAEETAIVRRVQRANLFVFLRQQRHVRFSEEFQRELATTLYDDKPKGHPPLPPN